MIPGIDVYEGDNISSFGILRQNQDILIQKATEGITKVDSLLNYRYNRARTYGFKFGVYHFAHNRNGAIEAQFFYDNIKDYKLDLYPILDIEVEENWSKSRAIEYVNQFNKYILEKIGVKPAIYTGNSFFLNYLKDNIPNKILWIADYGMKPDGYPNNSWQYTEHGRIAGTVGDVDANYFNENILWNGGGNKEVDTIVVSGRGADENSANILADYLNCPVIFNDRKFDFSCVKNVIGVGGKKEQYTTYLTKLIAGSDRYSTNQAVLDFIKNGGK